MSTPMIDPPKVALVGCGKAKKAAASPALHLYTGRLFRAAADFARATHDEVFIVSALHGLIDLERVIAPYEVSIQDLRARGADLSAWGHDVARGLREQMGGVPIAITLLMGESYAKHLRPWLHGGDPEADRWPALVELLRGIAGVGPRTKRLCEMLAAAERPTS